jgi:hypothetical protein
MRNHIAMCIIMRRALREIARTTFDDQNWCGAQGSDGTCPGCLARNALREAGLEVPEKKLGVPRAR